MEEKVTKIWQEFHNQLFAFIYDKVKNKELAEDILMNVFIKIQTKLSSLKDEGKLDKWIFQITRNEIADHYRTKKDHYELNEDIDILDDDDEIIEDGNINWLSDFINVLPENYKNAVISPDIQSNPLKELAKEQDITYANAKIRVQRGRKLLRQNLDDCCNFYVDKYGKILDYKRKSSSCNNCK